jgi:hypothetical protein
MEINLDNLIYIIIIVNKNVQTYIVDPKEILITFLECDTLLYLN